MPRFLFYCLSPNYGFLLIAHLNRLCLSFTDLLMSVFYQIALLNFRSQFVQHLVGNVLLSISEFVAASVC